MSDGVARLLADLGYDSGRIAEEMRRVDLVIDNFDPWRNRPGMAITTTCGVALGIQSAA